MNILKQKDFSDFQFNNKGNDLIAKLLVQIRKLNKMNKVYSENIDKNGIEFIDSVIETLGIRFEFDTEEIKRIPTEGSFITVSNHPFGGIDGLLLLKIVSQVRPDFILLANYLLHKIEPLKDYSLPLNNFETQNTEKFSFTGIKKAVTHLNEQHPIGIFPAVEISKIYSMNNISDSEWQKTLLKFIKNAKVPVVPVYFQGSNSWFFHLLGSMHPLLQSVQLPNEFFNKKKQTITIRFGKPIPVEEQNAFGNLAMYGRFLRAKTYALGTSLEVKKFFSPKFIPRLKKIEKIIDPILLEKLRPEIALMKERFFLFNSGNFSVMCAPTVHIPNILHEIGRLREITFREVGEGTNKSIDIDEFDLYFYQLIVWDNTAEKIAGAYRVGKGNEIMSQFGIKGFYIQTLFNIEKPFFPIMNEALELGRSFIIKEYQRRPHSLFLLWKGLLYFLLKNTEFRYLIGPASISNEFSKFSQSLIVDFFTSNYYNSELAQYIKPRKRFKVKKNPNIDNDIFLKNTEGNLTKLDKFIQDIEPEYHTPVLFKKYIGLNAKLIGFNVDPKFNDCVDGLMLLDIFDVPIQTLKTLSKELDDESILERFNV